MADGLPANGIYVLGFVALSGWSVVGYFFRLYFSGRLHPQATVDRMVAEHVREVGDISHDRDEWRSESRIKDAQLAERDRQLSMLTEVGHTTRATLRAVMQAAGKAVPDMPGVEETTP